MYFAKEYVAAKIKLCTRYFAVEVVPKTRTDADGLLEYLAAEGDIVKISAAVLLTSRYCLLVNTEIVAKVSYQNNPENLLA